MMLCLQVISSMIPNDDFGGFEPLRLQVRLYKNKIQKVINILLWVCPFDNCPCVFSTETWFLWAPDGWRSVSIITNQIDMFEPELAAVQCEDQDWFCLTPPDRDSRYMRVRVPYMARGQGQLTVPGGAKVFLFGEEDRDGMAMVIFDGKVREDISEISQIYSVKLTRTSSVVWWVFVFLFLLKYLRFPGWF